MLTSPEATEKTIRVSEFGEKASESAANYALLSLYSSELDMEKLSITPFDVCILDTVYTMCQDAKTSFTIEELANRMARKEVKFNSTKMEFDRESNKHISKIFLSQDANPNKTPEQLNFYNFLHYSVSKLSFIKIAIDCSALPRLDENEVKYDRIILEGSLLPVNAILYRTNVVKEEKIKYTFATIPVLYEYAERYKRIAAAPAKVLRTPLNVNPENISLTNEIAKTISLMKNPNNNYHSRDITYEWTVNGVEKGLLARLGFYRSQYSSAAAWSRKKSTLHKDLGKILESYKNSGLIKDYSENKKGTVYIGYHIEIF